MHCLLETQQAVLAALFGRGEAAHLVRGDGLDPARRLQVYRNNLFASLTGALADVHPVTRRLVGEGFFDYAADAYIRAHPSRQGNLHCFGEAFADFLAGFAPATGLPYLADVARVEWAWHEVYHAAAAPALAPAALAAVAPERLPGLRFLLQPAARLIASSWPIHTIWSANQDDAGGAVDLDAGGEAVLVIQRALSVDVERLGPGEHAWLAALRDGQGLGEAVAAAMAAEAAFDLPSALLRAVHSGVLCGPCD